MALPSGAEIGAALRGLGMVLRGNPEALYWYDMSADGFWRSFWLPLLAALCYFLLQEPNPAVLAAWDGSRIGPVLVDAGQYLSAWILYLLAMVLLCRAFQLTARYAAFVIVYNWSQAIVTAASLPVLVASRWDWLPAGTLAGWHFTMLFVWLYVVAQAARLALGAPALAAVMAAGLDLAVTVLLHRLVVFIL